MTDDKIESLKRRVAERREAASRKLKETLGGRLPSQPSQAARTASPGMDQATMQAAGAMFGEPTETDPIGARTRYGTETAPTSARPAAPTGKWRCIVNSRIVSIDLIANVSENGSLSGQGTIVYVATNRIYQVSGQGDWTALPPDPTSPKWLFKFRLQPSNHPIFSWFAARTESANHLNSRFVVPNNGGVVETNCERVG